MENTVIISITSELTCVVLSAFIWMFLIAQKKRSNVDNDIRKIIFFGIFLLFCDVIAYTSKYNVFPHTYYLVRISNYLVFALSYILVIFMGKYFYDYIKPNEEEKKLFRIVKIYAYISRQPQYLGIPTICF